MLQVLRPLSIGELLDRTFLFYRRNFLVFVGIAALPGLLGFGYQLAGVSLRHDVASNVTAAGVVFALAWMIASMFVYLLTTTLAHGAFISGLNTIVLVAAFVLFTGAILAFVLVRQQDFVESGAEAAAASG